MRSHKLITIPISFTFQIQLPGINLSVNNQKRQEVPEERKGKRNLSECVTFFKLKKKPHYRQNVVEQNVVFLPIPFLGPRVLSCIL